jgi:hypothetical protein
MAWFAMLQKGLQRGVPMENQVNEQKSGSSNTNEPLMPLQAPIDYGAQVNKTNDRIGPLQAPIEFGAHALSFAVTLFIIGVVAVGLQLAIHWLETSFAGKISPVTINGLKGVDHFLFLVDLALFIVYIVRFALRKLSKL